jgi:diacylglycerol kinase family enzyme
MPQDLPMPEPARCRVALIANAHAGRKDAGARIAHIRSRLAPQVAEFTLKPVAKGGQIADAARRAVAEGYDIVAALGGDGTQSAVAGALAGSAAAMAVLPGGTFNYFARELGVEDMDRALEAVLGGRGQARDLGAINDRIFINNASIGIYPQILVQREEIYRRWGRSRIAAYWSVLVALRDLRDPMHLQVTVDGQPRDYRTSLAFVARSAYQLDTLGLAGAEAVRAGHFALFLAKGRTRWELMSAAIRLAFGRTAHGADFDLVISDDMVIESSSPRKLVALDGEKVRMTAPFRLKVLHGGLRVCVPAEEPAA